MKTTCNDNGTDERCSIYADHTRDDTQTSQCARTITGVCPTWVHPPLAIDQATAYPSASRAHAAASSSGDGSVLTRASAAATAAAASS